MSEIRLVRCPKCSKLLPEPSQYAVYQCGGCGVVLRAMKSTLCDEDEERIKELGRSKDRSCDQDGTFDMGTRSPARSTFGDDFRGKSTLRESDLSEFDGELPKSPLRDRFLSDLGSVPNSPMRSRNISESPLRERGGLDDSSFNGVDKSPEGSRNVSKSPVREMRGRTPVSVRSRNFSRSPIRESTLTDFNGVNKSPARSFNGDIMKSPMSRGLISEFDEDVEEEQERKSRGMKMTPKTSFNVWLPDEKHTEKSDDNYSARRRTLRDPSGDWADPITEGRESVYANEHGMTSEGSIDPIHEIDPRKERLHNDLRFKGDYVGQSTKSRATINQQVTNRDGVVYGNSKLDVENGFFSPGYYGGLDDFSEDESLRFRRRFMQQSALDKSDWRHPYVNHGPRWVHNKEDTYNFHPPLYDDPYLSKMTRGAGPKQPHQFLKHSIPGYLPGRSMEFDHNPLESYLDETHYHHPACSCSLCYTNNMQGQNLPNSLANRRSSHSMNLERYVPRAYNPRMAQTNPQERPSHVARRHPRRVLVSNLNKRLCHPIAGGTPFVLCQSCFRLLELPKKLMAVQKTHHKLRCGACSNVMSFNIQNALKKPDYVDNTSSSSDVLKGSGPAINQPDTDPARYWPGSDPVRPTPLHKPTGSFAASSTNLGSYDFDAVGYSFQSMDSNPSEVSKEKRLTSCATENSSVQSSLPNSTEMPSKINLVPLLPGSPSYHTVEEKKLPEKDNSPDSSIENSGVAVETKVHSNEIPTTSLSQDSVDLSTEEDEVENNKDRQSHVAAVMRGYVSKSSNGSPGKAEVYVNGQPIPHRVVKMAEKFAGEIQPGEYWYDSKAGFWGVMGHRCFGIIPPFIQEFSFPMPENCSGGDTAVYVNGRELHKRDLDLLARRGLPNTRNKNYVIDFSGEVLDEETKEFVVNLGKLAPTVERKKCGFGMRVPEQLDD